MCKYSVKRQGRTTTVTVPEGFPSIRTFLENLSTWRNYNRDERTYSYAIEGEIAQSIEPILNKAFNVKLIDA